MTDPTECVVTATIRATNQRARDDAHGELARIVAEHGEWDDVTEASVELATVHPDEPAAFGSWGEAFSEAVADAVERRWNEHNAAEVAELDPPAAPEAGPTVRAEQYAELGDTVTVWARYPDGRWRYVSVGGEWLDEDTGPDCGPDELWPLGIVEIPAGAQ